jgi:cytochrome P450
VKNVQVYCKNSISFDFLAKKGHIYQLNPLVLRFIPTKKNQMRWQIDKEIRNSLRKLIETNRHNCVESKNLLGLMLAASKSDGQELGIEEIIDECKAFYFAGKETTANLLTWAVLLLAVHGEWQHKAREEVMAVCGKDQHPSADGLANLKTVSFYNIYCRN